MDGVGRKPALGEVVSVEAKRVPDSDVDVQESLVRQIDEKYHGHLCRGLGVRKVDIRLPRKGNTNSHGARPVHQIISMIKWIRTSRLSIKNYVCRSPSYVRLMKNIMATCVRG